MTTDTAFIIHELKGLWVMLFPDTKPPEDSQWALWFVLHDPATVREGFGQLAAKRRKLRGNMDALYMAKFASAVMNRLSREKQQGQEIAMALKT
jgi:hypothetical protein